MAYNFHMNRLIIEECTRVASCMVGGNSIRSTVRMGLRRFTRLTNVFSKKLENHKHTVAHYVMYYNFARIHQTLRVTPAIEAGIAVHVWTLEEIVGLLD
jgi:hypothetical protein